MSSTKDKGYSIRRTVVATKPLDYRKLWEDLKGELECEAIGKTSRVANGFTEDGTSRAFVTYHVDDSARNSQEMLDRMNQAETLARFKGGV